MDAPPSRPVPASIRYNASRSAGCARCPPPSRGSVLPTAFRCACTRSCSTARIFAHRLEDLADAVVELRRGHQVDRARHPHIGVDRAAKLERSLDQSVTEKLIVRLGGKNCLAVLPSPACGQSTSRHTAAGLAFYRSSFNKLSRSGAS